MSIGLHLMYPFFLAEFNEIEFFQKILEKYSNFMKIRPVVAELFHADGQT
jgi:hypothetical protein